MRIEEADDAVRRLRDEIGGWFDRKSRTDASGQFETQLKALRATVGPVLDAIVAELAGVAPAEGSGRVYAACRLAERRAEFVRRYWSWYAAKWDQRDHPRLGPVLRAADEVVWSCWTAPFTAVLRDPDPAPLAYLEPHFTPRAIPRVQPPPDLREADLVLRDALRILPVPVLGLPTACAARPWWLVHIAHESGHHVEHDLSPGLRAAFAEMVAAAAASAGASDEQWRAWHDEVFADAFSVLAVGRSAAWATGELIEAPTTEREVARPGYPPAAVREATMAAVLDRAGGVHGEDGGAPSAVARAVVDTALDGHPPLPRLCDFDATRFREDGEVARWRAAWLAPDDPLPETRLRSARMAVAGAVEAWRTIAVEEDGDARRERTDSLAERLRLTLPECKPPGRRAAPPERAPVEPARDALAAAALGARLEVEP